MSELPPAHGSTARAVRHHLAVVVACLALGGLAGWLYAGSTPARYTSTTNVLINPSVGNPYAPTPASVRQDELTSLETEAQVARSAEVLGPVSDRLPSLSTKQLMRGVQITVPPNTQILQISYTATDAALAQQVADAVATAYLDNRQRRFDDVTLDRMAGVEDQTLEVVDDLRAATAAAQQGSPGARLFQTQLADALRNELVSLRAQRTALENSESPAGAVISPATTPSDAGGLTEIVMPTGGALLGLALGCALAVLLERLRGVVRATREVEQSGLPVVAGVPVPSLRTRLLRRADVDAVASTLRRLRAAVLDRDPRPDVIAVAPGGSGLSDADVSEAVAASFAKAGHRVVLVRTDDDPAVGGLGVGERGLADALLHERLNVLDLLQPSVDPLLCLLPSGRFTSQSRELLAADRLRAVLTPLIEDGHLVVVQAPGIDSADGEAVVGAADLGLVVVRLGRTRPAELHHAAEQARVRGTTLGTTLGAVVIGHEPSTRRALRESRSGDLRDAEGRDAGVETDEAPVRTERPRPRR